MRRIIIGLVVVGTLGAIAVSITLRAPGVDSYLLERAMSRAVDARVPVLAGSNELAVLLCGTGSPIPDRQRAGPCTLVAAGDRLFVVDAGIGSVQNLMLWHIPLRDVSGVLLTHFHSDHIPALGELRLQTWVAGRQHHLPVYGPPGVEQVVDGFEAAYRLDTVYRTEHHGADFLPPDAAPMDAHPVPIPEGAFSALVLDQEGLKITAIRVNHGPVKPAYGYRFDYEGRSVVVSGDTAPDDDLAKAGTDTDVLVHEALQPQMVGMLGQALSKAGRSRNAKIMHDIPGYHTSPVDAARIANAAGARKLVFTHIIPPLPNAAARHIFLSGVSDIRPEGVEIGHDGLLIRLPARSKDIIETTLGD